MSNRFTIVKLGPANPSPYYGYEDFGGCGPVCRGKKAIAKAAKAVTKAVKKTTEKVAERRQGREEAWWQADARHERQAGRETQYHFIPSEANMTDAECAAADWCLAVGDELYFEWYSKLADVMKEAVVQNASQNFLYNRYPFLKNFNTLDFFDFQAAFTGNYTPTVGNGLYAEDIFIGRQEVENIPLLEKRLEGALTYQKTAAAQEKLLAEGTAHQIFQAIIKAGKASGIGWLPSKIIEGAYEQIEDAVVESRILNDHLIKMLQARIAILGGNKDPTKLQVLGLSTGLRVRSVPGLDFKLPAFLVPDPAKMQVKTTVTSYAPLPGSGKEPFTEVTRTATSTDKKYLIVFGISSTLLFLSWVLSD